MCMFGERYKPKHKEHCLRMVDEYEEWLANGKKPNKTQMHDDFRALIEKYAKLGIAVKSVDASFINNNIVGSREKFVDVVEINSEA